MANRRKHAAFTLVEVLVVAVIISILLGLVSAAVFGALKRAKEVAIFSEAKALELSMEEFKTHYQSGDPPADLRFPDQSTSLIYKFVARTFSRYDITRLKADLDAEQIAYANFDPGYSLMFWLVGFSGDASNPFRGHYQRLQGKELTKAFFDFDPERIVDGHYFPVSPAYFTDDDNDGVWDPGSAFANGAWGTAGEDYDEKVAFLYFDFKSYTYIYEDFEPYQKVENGQHYNHHTHQIINAGLDRELGFGGSPYAADLDPSDGVYVPGPPADGEPFIGPDADNIANFAGGTVGDYTDK